MGPSPWVQRRRETLAAEVNLGLGVLVGGLWLTGSTSTARGLTVLVFLIAGPGHAIVSLLDIEELPLRIALTVSVGIAVSMFISMVMAYTHWWSPLAGYVVVMAVVIGFSALHLRRLSARGQ